MDRNPYAPLPGKCIWWREFSIEDDKWDTRIKESEKGVACSCFVEGKGWKFTKSELPPDCPNARACRYYIKNV